MNPSQSPGDRRDFGVLIEIEQTPPISSGLPELIKGSTEFAGDAETVAHPR